MDISYDPTKNEKNIAERKLSFEMARDFDVAPALIVEDLRKANSREVKRYEQKNQ